MPFQSQQGTVGSWQTENPDANDMSGDDEGYFPVSRLRTQYVDYITTKQLEIEEQKQARHYYNAAQWTPEQLEVLRKRRQPVITFNRVGRKIDSIVGLLCRLRQDPKAFPKNPKNADGAEIATESVRTVLEASDWESIDPTCAGQAAIEGIAGIEIKLIDGDHNDPDVAVDLVYGDDFFYDGRSARPDFSDARYMGIAKWLDVEAAVELFPKKEEELRSLLVDTGFDLSTHSDREFKWVLTNEKRVRLVEHWYRSKGKWFWCFYCSDIVLQEGESEFVDERGQSMCRFVMFSAAVDHDGDRYGFIRNMKGPQDELNQRRSKALFMSNVSRLVLQKGSVDNVQTTRLEFARPDGVVEYNQGFERPKPEDNTADLGQQLQLMQDARQEIDSFANINPALLGQDGPDEHSGVAINLLQKAGIAELGSFLRNYRAWKKRVYRGVWNTVQRNWQSERFIRVTDNQGLAQFLQINGERLDEYGQPVMVNAIGALNVEITLDEGPDEANLMNDAWDVIKQQPPGSFPPAVLVEFMPLSAKMKQRLLQLLQQPVDPQVQQNKQLTNQRLAAEIDEKNAGTQMRKAQALHHVASAAKATSEAHSSLADIERDDFLATQQGAPQQAQPPAKGLPPWQPQATPQLPPTFRGGGQGFAPPPQAPSPGMIPQPGS